MAYAEKMDLVLEKLFVESGHAPTMVKLIDWLEKKDIHKGEIEDITLHLYREQYIYCCDAAGNRDAKYFDEGMFLISCKGKLFWENEHGFVKYFKRLADERQSILDQNQRMERNEERLVLWTKLLTLATILGATMIVGWEYYKTFYVHLSCGK